MTSFFERWSRVIKRHRRDRPAPMPVLSGGRTIDLTVRGIELRSEGRKLIVSLWMPDGSYVSVIEEYAETPPINHCVHVGGLETCLDRGTNPYGR